jgi:hypothetical protein
MHMKNTLFFIAFFLSFNIYSMQVPDGVPPQAPDGNAAPAVPPAGGGGKSAKEKYYETKADVEKRTADLQEAAGSVRGLTEQQAIRETVGIVARKVDSGLTLMLDAARKYLFGLSEAEEIEKEVLGLDRDIKKESLIGQQQANKTADETKDKNKKEADVLDKQDINADLDALEKLAMRLPGGQKNPEVIRRRNEIAARLGLKLAEEKPKEDTKSVTPKITLFSRFSKLFGIASTMALGGIDFLADKSFVHITNLEHFKDTPISMHAKNINRALVVVTIAGISGATYKLHRYLDDEDGDIFDNDAED